MSVCDHSGVYKSIPIPIRLHSHTESLEVCASTFKIPIQSNSHCVVGEVMMQIEMVLFLWSIPNQEGLIIGSFNPVTFQLPDCLSNGCYKVMDDTSVHLSYSKSMGSDINSRVSTVSVSHPQILLFSHPNHHVAEGLVEQRKLKDVGVLRSDLIHHQFPLSSEYHWL